ncbi:hypothetical protein Hypma_005534 [Hypsizygus marmoreus]|uniref:Uncharacterized protein n=1 Tax=Hypsizygus marmoreus TaxID=39966 RepID=A0A369K1N2_HYPMA|nr:hypothetical protein Hypma_005534 [Hypsizygus marmoreus]
MKVRAQYVALPHFVYLRTLPRSTPTPSNASIPPSQMAPVHNYTPPPNPDIIIITTKEYQLTQHNPIDIELRNRYIPGNINYKPQAIGTML